MLSIYMRLIIYALYAAPLKLVAMDIAGHSLNIAAEKHCGLHGATKQCNGTALDQMQKST
ncbi:hypothetical protein WKK05_36930 (plasmid) [Nostoc sp. UHCC 0302]|uniref:hypothetical protein n=1 Tax=Nostoc sp. UHCC 0302 TaxID=3134896 RepID=UPI00311CB669